MTCTQTQEKLARGEALDDLERDHALACADCGILVALASTLDALDPGVPPGFADRVMARITAEAGGSAPEPPRPPRWYEGRWAGALLTAAAALVALLNAAKFFISVLLPVGSFGGAP